MERFCYICGEKEKPSSPLIEGLCQKCFADRFKMLVVPKKISLTVCKGCGMYFWKGAWIKPSDVEDIVRSAVLQEVSVANLVDGERVLVPLCSADVEATVIPRPKAGVAEVEVRGKSHKNQAEPKTEKAEIKVEIFRKLCKTCSLKAAGRYEAVLQLRGVRGDEPIEEAAGIIQGVIATMERASPQDFLVRIEKEGEGLNLYLGSLNLGKRLSELLRKSGARVVETAKLIGQTKDGRKKYRVTILAKISEEAIRRLVKHSGFKGGER